MNLGRAELAVLFAAGLAAAGVSRPDPSSARADDAEPPSYVWQVASEASATPSGAFADTVEAHRTRRYALDPNRCEFAYNALGQLVFKQCGRRTWEYSYNGFGDLVATRRGVGPPLPRFGVEERDVGDVDLAGSAALEGRADGSRTLVLRDLVVTVRDGHGERSAAAPAGTAVPLAVRPGGAGPRFSFRARLADGSTCSATLVYSGFAGAGPDERLTVSVGSLRLGGRLAGGNGVPRTKVNGSRLTGSLRLPFAVRLFEFDAAWDSATRGTATLLGPPEHAGRTASIRRAKSGTLSLRNAGARLRMEVRPDGSGWFDEGYGIVRFQAGITRFGTSGDRDQIRLLDAADPADDTSVGATPLGSALSGTTPEHTLSRSDREDWFAIDLAAGSVASFGADPGVRLELLDPDGAPAGALADHRAAATGTYRVRVTPDIADYDFRSVAYSLQWDVTPLPVPVTLAAPPGADEDRFGLCVALDGDTAIVGHALADAERGAADVYVRDGQGWTLQQTLVAPDGSAGDQFGGAVGLSGDTCVCGAPSDGSAAGAGYVFVRSQGVWSFEQKLADPLGADGQALGSVAAVSGDTVLLTKSTPHSGEVHVFERSNGTWSHVQPLGGIDLLYGFTLALDGDTAFVGIPGRYTYAGTVREYRRGAGGAWALANEINASTFGQYNLFGISMALAGDRLLVGDRSAGYVFTRSDGVWTDERILRVPNPPVDYGFGVTVALDGDRAAVGTPTVHLVYTFRLRPAGWTREFDLAHAADGNQAALDLGPGRLLLGAPSDPPHGAAYVFEFQGD